MSACKFLIPYTSSSAAIIVNAKNAIEHNKGTFNPGERSFSVPTPVGTITGAYVVEEKHFVITIISKPFLASCSKIQKVLTDAMTSQEAKPLS